MRSLFLVTLLAGCNLVNTTSPIVKIDHKLVALEQKEQEDLQVGQYAINMMVQAGANKLSDAKKQVLARAIVRVSEDVFDNFEQKKAFIAVLAIESGFNKFAQSPTGPKGYSQVTKSTFKEALAMCGVTAIDEEDVWETDLNLYAGACYFRNLLDKYNNDVYKALVAYNQGPSSSSLKSYSKNGSLTEIEPLKYIAKYTFLKNNTPTEKAHNAPAMENMKVDKK